MSLRLLVLRLLGLVAMAIWFGGFTFYSAVVVAVLHDALGSVAGGQITQRVTVTLNTIGLVAVALWWLLVVAEPQERKGVRGKARLGLLVATTVLLAFLIVLHGELDRRLDAGHLLGFYPLHRVYLVASTAQWFANLGLLALLLGPRREPRTAECHPREHEPR